MENQFHYIYQKEKEKMTKFKVSVSIILTLFAIVLGSNMISHVEASITGADAAMAEIMAM